MSPSPLVRAASLKNYPEIAAACGLDAPRMMADFAISASVFDEPDLMVPADRVSQLLEASATRSGVESFGLRMAETRHLSNLGPVGLVIRDQPTLRDSLGVLIRYHAALNGALSIAIEESAGVVVIREDVLVGGSTAVRQATELAIGVLLRLMRQVLGPQWQPRRVCFTHTAPRDTRTHLRVFGPCVEFRHDFNGIVCSRDELDTVNPTADPAMARYAERLLDQTLPATANLLSDVRRTVLLLLPSGRCSIEQVANHLGIVCRTVQRRLAEQGLSFSELVNAQRVELARRYVTQSDRPLTEIAGLLGFAASSGFSRWYQAQFGCSATHSRGAARSGRMPAR
ncbi:AraC family transcriptional regulator [Rhizobacter fulvus]|jgi:AraC-like DNA-binding protein